MNAKTETGGRGRMKGVKHQSKKRKDFGLQRIHSFTDDPFRKLFKTLSNLSSHSNSGSAENLLRKSVSHDLIPDSYFNRPLINSSSDVSSSVAYRSANGPLRLIKSTSADTTKKKILPSATKLLTKESKTQPAASATNVLDKTITPKSQPAQTAIAEEKSTNKPITKEFSNNSAKSNVKLEHKFNQLHISEKQDKICSSVESNEGGKVLFKNVKDKQRIKKSNSNSLISAEVVKLTDNNSKISKHLLYSTPASSAGDVVTGVSKTVNVITSVSNPANVIAAVSKPLDCGKSKIDTKASLAKRPPIPPQHKVSKSSAIHIVDKNKSNDSNIHSSSDVILVNNTHPSSSKDSFTNDQLITNVDSSKNIHSSYNSFHTIPYSSTRKRTNAQQVIRDEQEKTLIQLHQKHLKEIFNLRSKQSPTDNKDDKIAKEVKYNKGDKELPINTSSNSPSSSIKINDIKKKKGILKKPSSGCKSKSSGKDEESFSFSGYLKRSRSKDSIGSKDENSNSVGTNPAEAKDKPNVCDDTDSKCNQNVDNVNNNVEDQVHKVSEIKVRKVEFSEQLENIIDSKSDAQLDAYSRAKQNLIKVKDLKITPKKPPRSEKNLQKKISISTESNDMKHHRHHRSLKENNSSGNKQTSENNHPPLQKVSRGRQYKPPELEDDPFEMCIATNKKSLPEQKNDPLEISQEQYKDKPPDNVASPPVPPARGNKPRDDFLAKNNNNDNKRQEKSHNERIFSPGILLIACANGEEDEITKLLKDMTKTSQMEPTTLNELDIAGRTALSHCCTNGYRRAVEILTAHSNIDMNLSDSEGNGPLHYASQGGHVEVVSHLVNTCSRQVDLDARNIHGFTPLMKAAIQGRTKIAKILLFAGASPHLRDYGRGLNALEWARYTGRGVCSDLIDSVQRSCSNYIRDRWSSESEIRPSSGTAIPPQQYYQLGPDKNSWFKHKIKKAFHKSDSKKEFSVASNLSNLATCVSSPLVSVPAPPSDAPVSLPKVKVTEVTAPDCYNDPEEPQSPVSESFSVEYTSSSNPTTPE